MTSKQYDPIIALELIEHCIKTEAGIVENKGKYYCAFSGNYCSTLPCIYLSKDKGGKNLEGILYKECFKKSLDN